MLRSVHAVNSSTVGNEANGIKFVQRSLQCRVDDIVKLGFEETRQSGTILSVLFAETVAWGEE